VFNWEKAGIDITNVRGGKAFCPKCHDTRKDKRDRSLSVNLQNGVYNCHYHGCEFKGSVMERPQKIIKKDFTPPVPRPQKVSDKMLKWFEDVRKISNNTLLRMKITESEEWFGEKMTAICFNYFKDDKLVNIKFRTGDKRFKMSAGAELIPYNLDAAKGEKELLWVEGEIDLLTCIECGIYNVV
jgi:twinkle protein